MARQTSVAAYYAIQQDGTISKQQQRIYAKLFHHGPLTATECLLLIDADMKSAGMKGVNMNTRTRFGELRDRGVLYEVQTRTCKETGVNVIEWDVTVNLAGPKPVSTTPTRKEFAEAADELLKLFYVAKNAGHPFSGTLKKICGWVRKKGEPSN